MTTRPNGRHSNTCTHEYHHIAQNIQDLSDSTQQNDLHSIEENASLYYCNQERLRCNGILIISKA